MKLSSLRRKHENPKPCVACYMIRVDHILKYYMTMLRNAIETPNLLRANSYCKKKTFQNTTPFDYVKNLF